MCRSYFGGLKFQGWAILPSSQENERAKDHKSAKKTQLVFQEEEED
jgi:hypothetical protein